jgi:hypothetical protein
MNLKNIYPGGFLDFFKHMMGSSGGEFPLSKVLFG